MGDDDSSGAHEPRPEPISPLPAPDPNIDHMVQEGLESPGGIEPPSSTPAPHEHRDS